MIFEWDEAKRKSNPRKHRIDFADVPQVFLSPMVVSPDDRQEYGELRWIGIGMLSNGVVVVVYVERDENAIRIVSARKAEKHERARYFAAIKEIGH